MQKCRINGASQTLILHVSMCVSKRWISIDVIFLRVGQKDMVYSENELAFLSKVHLLLLLYDIEFVLYLGKW